MREQPAQPYQYTGKNHNYGPTAYSAEEMRRAYEEDAPACHHPGRTMSRVALDQLGAGEQSAIKANSVADDTDFDTELRMLTGEN